MWRYLVFLFCFASALEEYSPNYFCADMSPQQIMSVEQLMGMWFVVEKIDHLDERHYARSLSSCPIVHISADHPPTTVNPLYRDNQYRNYGQGYGYGTDRPQYRKTQEQIERERQQRSDYEGGINERYNPRKLHHNYNAERRYLRVYWDEEGSSTEYHVWHNITAPGFWISSGPQNGASLKSQFSHYAGNIQVLKVVGDHMVLTFCHQLPRQLFSVLLSRETKLSSVEVHSVHRMLNRRGLKTSASEKLCNNSGSKLVVVSWSSLTLFIVFMYKIVK